MFCLWRSFYRLKCLKIGPVCFAISQNTNRIQIKLVVPVRKRSGEENTLHKYFLRLYNMPVSVGATTAWTWRRRKYTLANQCNKNQLDAQFLLSLFRQSTSTCFGHICSPLSGSTLYIYNNWYVTCFLVDCLLAGQQTVVCIQYNSWRWATNMLETCRGWLNGSIMMCL